MSSHGAVQAGTRDGLSTPSAEGASALWTLKIEPVDRVVHELEEEVLRHRQAAHLARMGALVLTACLVVGGAYVANRFATGLVKPVPYGLDVVSMTSAVVGYVAWRLFAAHGRHACTCVRREALLRTLGRLRNSYEYALRSASSNSARRTRVVAAETTSEAASGQSVESHNAGETMVREAVASLSDAEVRDLFGEKKTQAAPDNTPSFRAVTGKKEAGQ